MHGHGGDWGVAMAADRASLLRWLMPDSVPEPISGPDGRLAPPVPIGRRMRLAGRGTTFVREVPGPPGAPTLVLLHGWMASGGLNWFRAFEALGRDFRVLAPDLRGHARGLRSRRHFRLADCADDLAALLGALDVGPAVVVGYSMGGPVAELLWRRHRERVSGLVLCATAPRVPLESGAEWLADVVLGALTRAARVAGHFTRVPAAGARVLRSARASRPADFVEWALAELRRHDLRMLLEAARAMSAYDATSWIHELDVPTAVLVTRRDRTVAPRAQLELAEAVSGSSVHDVDGGHAVCARERFVPPLLEACHSVAARVSA